ncbi:tRNA 2-methylthio-N6-isopentenyl adenosine(37) hydroxylase MiaE [Taibaiella sp. KBW10]|uniref:tRNA-(ms[2]io[6]A)-hydroxylase n=1 Tax=Taibaiella sp. KBW10 TaxID=2153357 RepID=UPI000F599F6F|nr:tRNA-(ms[2]io[6]A)-hydroxylase [Taibaiella sp. KBW10]RQO31565.1 tRNA 2-methylthio-N6-isopentenyl adenosine(37) hydroxylase MiaE [Taibaiella sp. KBW10]
MSENTILGLKLPTDPRWVDIAAISLEDILTDHAFCEQKAATTMISIIQRYSDREELVDKLAPVVTEEWGHFRMVLAELKKRGMHLGKQRKDDYVNALLAQEPKSISPEERLLHKLCICALIEARSCERFRLLSLHISDEKLKDFYHKFMVSEAGHYRLFLDLARTYYEEEKVRETWQGWLQIEKNIMADMPPRADRIH